MRHLLFPLLIVLTGLACRQSADQPSPCGEAASQKALSVYDFIQNKLELATEAEASALLESALSLAKNCSDFATDTLLAKASDRLARHLRDGSKSADARQRFVQALHFYQRAYPAQPPHLDILRMYHNIGLTLRDEDESLQALPWFDSAHVLTEASNPSPYVPNLIALGSTYLDMNELSLGEKYLLDARLRIDANSKIFKRLPFLLYRLSDCYRRQARLPDAFRAAQEGVALIRTNGWEVERRSNLATCLLNLGNAWQDSLLQLGNRHSPQKEEARDSAISFTRQALELYRQLDPPDPSNVGIASANLGELFRRSARYDQAVEVLTNTLRDSALQSHPAVLAKLYINRGETWLDRGDFDPALADFGQALRLLVPAWQPGGNHPLPPLDLPCRNRSDLLLTLSDLARAQVAKAKRHPEALEMAVTTYDTLLVLVNRIRGDYLSSDAKIRLAGQSQEHLRKAFELSLTLYELKGRDERYLERAFRVAEQSKALALLETVRLRHLSQRLPQALRQEEETLQKRQAELEGELFQSGGDSAGAVRLQEQWFANFEAFRRFKEQLKTSQRSYFNLRYSGADLAVADIRQRLLAPDQGLLEYFFRDSLLHVFLLTKDTFALATRRIGQDFPVQMDSLCAQIANLQPSPQGEASLCQAAHDAWNILLQPFQNQLPARLIVVPDYPLQRLPFEALLEKRAPGGVSEQVRERNFVLFQHQVSYCFSANLLWEMAQDDPARQPLKKTVAAFAPQFPERLQLPDPLPGNFRREELGLLRSIPNAPEVEAIGRQVRSQPFFAKAANKATFLEACGRYAVVHVSTHGILNHHEPDFNFIAFSQPDSLDADELLKLGDLYAEKIRSELIVFSACETAAGQRREGEGVISMARGLTCAGAKCVVSALFPVRPDNNGALFSGFYGRLAGTGSVPKDVALAGAKQDFVLRSPDNHHPANWSGIVLIGSTTPVALAGGGDSAWWWWLVFGGLAMLAALAAWRRFRRKN